MNDQDSRGGTQTILVLSARLKRQGCYDRHANPLRKDWRLTSLKRVLSHEKFTKMAYQDGGQIAMATKDKGKQLMKNISNTSLLTHLPLTVTSNSIYSKSYHAATKMGCF